MLSLIIHKCIFDCFFFCFFFNDTATTEIYTLSLHDALPISPMPTSASRNRGVGGSPGFIGGSSAGRVRRGRAVSCARMLVPPLASHPTRANSKRMCVYFIANPPSEQRICVYIKDNTSMLACYLDLFLSLAYLCTYRIRKRRCMGRRHDAMADRKVPEVSYGDHTE